MLLNNPGHKAILGINTVHLHGDHLLVNLYSKSTKGFVKEGGGCADVVAFYSLGGRRPSRGARVLSLGEEFGFLLLSAGRRSTVLAFCPIDENED